VHAWGDFELLRTRECGAAPSFLALVHAWGDFELLHTLHYDLQFL
jgi:hypothetical protein